MGRDQHGQAGVKPAWVKPIVVKEYRKRVAMLVHPRHQFARCPEAPRGAGASMSLGSARSQGQRQSSRLRGVIADVLSVRYRRRHAVQGQPRHQNQRYRDQQRNELSERRRRRALQDNGPSILKNIRFGNTPILVCDEEKKRTRHDEPELPAFCIAHEFLRQLEGLEAGSLPSQPWLPLRGCECCGMAVKGTSSLVRSPPPMNWANRRN